MHAPHVQPRTAGYLIAGIFAVCAGVELGRVVADRQLAEQLAEVGVILLLFGVGLHFHLRDLLAVKRLSLIHI